VRVHYLIFSFGLGQALVHLEVLIKNSIFAVCGQSIEKQYIKCGKAYHSVHFWCQTRLPELNGLVHVHCLGTICRAQNLICLLISVKILFCVIFEQVNISVPHNLEVDCLVVRHRIALGIVSPADSGHIV